MKYPPGLCLIVLFANTNPIPGTYFSLTKSESQPMYSLLGFQPTYKLPATPKLSLVLFLEADAKY